MRSVLRFRWYGLALLFHMGSYCSKRTSEGSVIIDGGTNWHGYRCNRGCRRRCTGHHHQCGYGPNANRGDGRGWRLQI